MPADMSCEGADQWLDDCRALFLFRHGFRELVRAVYEQLRDRTESSILHCDDSQRSARHRQLDRQTLKRPLIAIAIQQIEGKTVKAIATLSLNRSPSLPDLASAHEQGLINFDASNWSGFFLPKGTPMVIVRKLHDATVATMNTPEVQMHLKRIGADLVAPERRSPQYLTQFVASEIDKWAGPIKAAGVTGE
jgi:hypothetical protein